MLSVAFGPDSPFFLVRDPRAGCKLDDIVLACSLRKLGELFEAVRSTGGTRSFMRNARTPRWTGNEGFT